MSEVYNTTTRSICYAFQIYEIEQVLDNKIKKSIHL